MLGAAVMLVAGTEQDCVTAGQAAQSYRWRQGVISHPSTGGYYGNTQS